MSDDLAWLDELDELDDLELLEDEDEDEEEEEGDLDGLSDEELELLDDQLDLSEALREVLSEEYAEAAPEEMEAALLDLMDELTPAESVSFTKALRQIEAGAGQLVRDPTFKQVAGTALPLAGGTLGTIAGPGGTVVGSALGGAAGRALVGGAGTPPATAGTPASSALAAKPAAKAVVAMNDPAVAKAVLAAALGPEGQKFVNGIPVGAYLNMLGTFFGEAAAEADERMYEDQGTPAYMLDEQAPSGDPAAPGDRADALYAALLRPRERDLPEEVDWP